MRPKKYPAPEGMQTCSECQKTLPATQEFFGLDKKAASGFYFKCKECRRRWNAENKAKIAIQNKQGYEKHKEKRLESLYQYRAENPELIKEQSKRHYQRHKEKISEYNRKRRPLIKEQRAEYEREWRQKNPDKPRIYGIRRDARKQQLPDTFTSDQWITCLEYHNYCCAVCGCQLRDLFGNVEPQADHWIALSRDDCPGTVAGNMVCLCNTCNNSKHANMPDEWLTRKYGTRKANIILARVQAYFAWVLSQNNQENKSA